MPTTIARAGRPQARHALTQAGGRGGPPTGRVLLADPCRDTVESLGLLLRLWGFDVRTAETGPAALASAFADRPDAVLMEIGLPQLDGWEVARRLRARCGSTRLLLVAVSGYGSERDRARSREAGFDGHLVKPACPEVTREWLITHLAGRETVGRRRQEERG